MGTSVFYKIKRAGAAAPARFKYDIHKPHAPFESEKLHFKPVFNNEKFRNGLQNGVDY